MTDEGLSLFGPVLLLILFRPTLLPLALSHKQFWSNWIPTKLLPGAFARVESLCLCLKFNAPSFNPCRAAPAALKNISSIVLVLKNEFETVN